MEQKTENLTKREAKGIIEALLFATQRPLPVKEIKEIVEMQDTSLVREILNEIKQECIEQNKSFKLVEIAGGYQFTTDIIYAKWLRKLYKIEKSDFLTKPSLETLAIIAYKQPVTKAEMEFIRGVNVDGVIKNLLEKGFIRISGRKKVPGNPYLFATSRLFLQHFGLNSLEDLPNLPEFSEADIKLPGSEEMLMENLPEKSEVVQDETKEPAPEN